MFNDIFKAKNLFLIEIKTIKKIQSLIYKLINIFEHIFISFIKIKIQNISSWHLNRTHFITYNVCLHKFSLDDSKITMDDSLSTREMHILDYNTNLPFRTVIISKTDDDLIRHQLYTDLNHYKPGWNYQWI